jgi:hypothetical protein
VGNNQGQEVERETEECRLGGDVLRSGNIEYICMHRHDESKRGFFAGREISARTGTRGSFNANAESIAVGTELALLELGIGASGGDNTQPPVRRRRLVLL